jgi:hypothetical protein
MMTWKSPLSIGFDVVFGLLPGIYLAFVSLVVLFDPELGRAITSPERLLFSSIGVVGLIALTALMYVSLARGNTRHKPVFKIILGAGIALALFVPTLLFGMNIINDLDSPTGLIGFIAAVETPVVIVAIKHIIMLTRA